jgi:hypothetical protein
MEIVKPAVTAVWHNGWFIFSKMEFTQKENCIYLQLNIKKVATLPIGGTLAVMLQKTT